MHGIPGTTDRRKVTGIPLWFRLFAPALTVVVLANLLGMEIVVEISYHGRPLQVALTDARLYFVPLLLVLLYILCGWIRNRFSRSR